MCMNLDALHSDTNVFQTGLSKKKKKKKKSNLYESVSHDLTLENEDIFKETTARFSQF